MRNFQEHLINITPPVAASVVPAQDKNECI